MPAKVLRRELSGTTAESGPAGFPSIAPEEDAGGDWRAWWARADSAAKGKRWQEAEAACGRLIDLAREGEPYAGCLLEAYLGRGLARLASRDTFGAQEDFVHAADRAPGVEPALLLGKAYYLNGAREQAERTFSRFHDDAHAGAKAGVALWITAVYSKLGDYEKAREWSRRLGEAPIVRKLEPFFLYRLGRRREAIVQAREVVARDPEDLTAHLVLAAALLKDVWSRAGPGRGEELALLLEASRRAVALDPGNRTARGLLAAAEEEASRLERSRAMDARRNRAGAAGALLALMAAAPALGGEPVTQEGAFGDVRPVEELNTPSVEWRPVISHDGRTLVFGSNRQGGAGGSDLYLATREGPGVPFTEVTNIAEINTASDEASGCLSADGREFFFSSDRSGGAGSYDLYKATRDGPGGPWGVENLWQLNTAGTEAQTWISEDGEKLYFAAHVDFTDSRILVATRAGPGEPFDEPPQTVFASEYTAVGPSLSADGSTLFFGDHLSDTVRPGSRGRLDVWMLTRSSASEPFGPPVNLGPPVNTPVCESFPSISSSWPAAGSELFFLRAICEAPDVDIYVATWNPPPSGVGPFLRGDCDGDGRLPGAVNDAIANFQHCFRGREVACRAACDADGDGNPCTGVTDGILILNYLFRGGGPLPAPFPECGTSDLAGDTELGCERSGCPS